VDGEARRDPAGDIHSVYFKTQIVGISFWMYPLSKIRLLVSVKQRANPWKPLAKPVQRLCQSAFLLTV